MELRKAKREDLEQIMELIDNAKCFLRSQGVDQWQNGYPDKDCLEKDIEKEIGYLCMLDGRPAGYVCIDFNGEPAYNTLSGSWLGSQPYVVLHRLALSPSFRGRGLAASVFQAAEKMARSKDVHSFKVDTDSQNLIMRHILEKQGFVYCGTICFDNSEKIAFEKLLL